MIVDVAGAQMGGAARFAIELRSYLSHTGRDDVQVIGAQRRVCPSWLLRRELTGPSKGRRIALNNVGFVTRGGERWTLLRNALHFLTDDEMSRLQPSVRTASRREAKIVRLAARRSDVLIAPSTSMADRIISILPSVRTRVHVRAHPVSAISRSCHTRDPAIICPVLFSPYKLMTNRLVEILAALEDYGDPSIRLRVTAEQSELPPYLASNPRIELIGRLDYDDLRQVSMRSAAIYFPTGIESFGYPLAEARVFGQPVIARDTAQNREIAGPALCGYSIGDTDSLQTAIKNAFTRSFAPDPAPFDPHSYFNWLFGIPR